jgi:hypothetical protein
MKSQMNVILHSLFSISIIILTGTTLCAQTGDPELDNELNAVKTAANNFLVFGFSYPSGNNKLVLNNGEISLNCIKSGWFKDDGSHSTTNPNYLSGFNSNYFRNFFVFDLSGIAVPLTSAVLQVQKYTSLPSTGFIPWQLFEVSSTYGSINTDYSASLGNLPAGLAIYNDLGGGVTFAADTINGSQPSNSIVSVVLNDSALQRLNAVLGGTFIIGGASDVFLPHLPPVATTLDATNIQSSDAILNGVVNPNGTTTSVNFFYGTTPGSLGSQVQVPGSFSGSSSVSVSATLTGLSDNTQYFFRIKAINTDLTSVFGQVLSFTTPPVLIRPPAPNALSPQIFCDGAKILDLQSVPPTGCSVHWFESVTGGNFLNDTTPLTPDLTYWAESYQISTGITSLTRTPVSVSLTFSPAPIVSGPQAVCQNPEISHYYTNSGMVNYEWFVSDGGTIASGGGLNDSFVVVEWDSTGEQSVQVNYSTLMGCRSHLPGMLNVLVQPLPVPTVTGMPVVCEGGAGSVYYTDPGMNNYIWTVSPGATIISGGDPASDSIRVIWNISSQQFIRVNYATSMGCTGISPTVYPVQVMQQSSPTIAGVSLTCAETEALPYTTEPGMVNYHWIVSQGGVIVSGQSTNTAIVSWETAGAQFVSVFYNNPNGCGSEISTYYPVTVTPNPVPKITGEGTLCVNSGNYIYTTDPDMSGYTWIISDGGTIQSGINSNEIEVFWHDSGMQSLSVIYTTQEGCLPIEPGTLEIIVEEVPGQAPAISGSAVVCSGSTGALYSVDPIAHADDYVWNLPAGAIIVSGAGTNSIMVDFPTTLFSGIITVHGKNNCGDGPLSPLFLVNVSPFPGIPMQISGVTEVCDNGSEAIYSVPPVTNATGYVWITPPGSAIISGSGTNEIRVFFPSNSTSGDIMVYGTNYCGAGKESADLYVTVNETPSAPMINLTGGVLESDATDGNQWYRDGTAIPGATRQGYEPSENGKYWSVVTLNGCSSDTSNNIDILMTSVGKTPEYSFEIFPVPNDGKFTVRYYSPESSAPTLRIYDFLGSLIYENRSVQDEGNHTLNIDLINSLPGNYVVVFQNKNLSVTRKIIIKSTP